MTTHSLSTAKSTLAAAFFALLAMTAVSSAQSDDATLSGLTTTPTTTFTPVFDSGTTSYTASVPYATTDITVTPTATDPAAAITVNTVLVTSGSPSGEISLSVGANPIPIVVVSQDTSATLTYTLTVTRETPNVDLSSLETSAGTLIPAFASGTISYNASVPTATTDITVTPTAVNPSAAITVNGTPVTSGSPSGSIALSMGSNTITTMVTGEDTPATTKTYTLTVTRGPRTLYSSGAKTWDTTTANWGLVAGGPYNTAIWSNSDGGDSAILNANGNNGTRTVTLGETINIKALSFSNLRNSGPVQKYTITGSTLAFSTGGTITTGTSLDNVNNAEYAYINSAITGSPNVSLSWTGGNNTLVFAPTSGSQALGTATGPGIVKLAGSTTGNTIVGLNASSNGKIRLTSGTWTLTGTATGYEHWIEAGTLIISTGSLQNNNRATNLSGGTLHWNNAGAIRDNSISTLRDRDFNITGGSIDNTSGGAITSSHNPQMVWGGNWTFIGSNGANSNLNMGTGQVFLNGNRQVTVTNAAATLTVGGVIANLDTNARSLTKAGDGTLELRGANSYTGATTVNAGTLKMGANNVIPNASNVTIGAATLDANTRTDTAGTLNVTGTDSVINLGAGAALAFANSSGVTAGVWAGTLDITGTFIAGNDVDPGLGVNPGSIRFGTDNTGLTVTQLAAISVNGSGAGTYTLDAFGYLKPSGGGPGPVDSFEISAISSPQTVGTPITGITITAKDASNATATSFTGTVTFGGTGGFTGTSASFTAGVLSGVSVTPTVAGSNLTFTVDDGASHTGSASITTIQTQYQFWAGGALFNEDANGDGVSNGLAFLLGAGGPNDNALGLLPEVTESGGDLVLNFDMLDAASRGTATLSIEHSSDLDTGDPWEATLVPDIDNTINDVVFDISGSGPLGVQATIPASKAADGKLFGRLRANQP
jgi:trimeric autotransporter adhesin